MPGTMLSAGKYSSRDLDFTGDFKVSWERQEAK